MYILDFLKFASTALRRFLRCRLLEGDTYKSQPRGLLKRLRPEPDVAVVEVHVDVTTVEVQAVRVATTPWVST